MNAKINLLILLLVSCSMFLLSSCEKEVYDSSKVNKTTDLVVPEGFDWAMTRSVDISMQSKNGTYASFYLDKDCKDLIAEMPVQAGESSVSLVLPTASSKIWVKYPVGEGKEETKEIAIKQKADTRAGGAPQWTADSLFPDYAMHKDNTNFTVYQPRKDQFGTIMFEDMWPEIGDYDFNDYVVNYNIVAEVKQNDYDNVHVTMSLKLRAIGGSRPYRFCIRIGSKPNSSAIELRKKDVTLGEVSITNTTDGKVEMLENTEYAVIALTGFDKLKSNTGGNFYNTESNHLVSNDATPEITIHLTVNNQPGGAYNLLQYGFGSEYAFDYFLQNTDNQREIHFIDYPPTDMYKGYEKDKENGSNTTYYCSDRQFVWALKAPVEMGWCAETKDISKVYPEFPEWVSKGGDWLEENSIWDSNRQWYNRPAPGSKDYINPKDH